MQEKFDRDGQPVDIEPVPETVREIWIYGSESGVAELRGKILDRIRAVYGSESVREDEETNAATLTIEWMRQPIALVLERHENVLKLRPAAKPAAWERDNAEFIVPLFHRDVVEPLADTTGGAVVSLNVWNSGEE